MTGWLTDGQMVRMMDKWLPDEDMVYLMDKWLLLRNLIDKWFSNGSLRVFEGLKKKQFLQYFLE